MYCKLWVILTLLQTISKLSIEVKETDVPSLNHGRSACDVTEHTNSQMLCSYAWIVYLIMVPLRPQSPLQAISWTLLV